ncbi:MAG TPA: glycosyltransferase [Bryobacteraceae bacterium]|nr:glycosyltransferase [Bryobacteraceae bacterium]
MNGSPTLDLIYIDSGGGHRAAARALEAVIQEQQRPWNLRLACVQDLLDSIDFIRKTTGIPFQEVYNIMLRRGWTMGTAQIIPAMHLVIRMLHRQQVEVLERHWRSHPADMVVSLIPHYNRALREAFAAACPGRPFVTILTDIADYPPHFWIERQDQYVVCGSERALQQARELGLPAERILPVSGMILHPRFYAAPSVDTAQARERLGLRPDLPTGLVMFGGEGSFDTVKVARALNRPGSGVQLILLCGRHEESARLVRQMAPEIPMFIEGFTREVPYYMALADFYIGKPGPGSISEALAMKLPVILERNIRTLAHERYNADWILEREVGLVVSNYDQVGHAVAELLDPERYARFRANAAAYRNRAVYEVVDWLDRILLHQPEPAAELAPRRKRPMHHKRLPGLSRFARR